MQTITRWQRGSLRCRCSAAQTDARRAPTSCSRRAALQLSAMTALLAGPLAPAGQALTPGQARTPYEEARRILLGPTKDK